MKLIDLQLSEEAIKGTKGVGLKIHEAMLC